ncbi:hypothetical protein GQ44DRAFT_768794 [Phaeosphaeriaceae sp. PMI808]|nr:hypothetical protein GQ44DRAFT_768794 [Phaeosphaeriaceae sp. PMI808]
MSRTPTNNSNCYCNKTTDHTPTKCTQLDSCPTAAHFSQLRVVYIVTDVCYPTNSDFNLNKGTFRIDSVHSNRENANDRAKKVILDGGQIDGGQYKVDSDQILVDLSDGLFTGIGTGGKGDGMQGNTYARKCQVERKIMDEDSEDDDAEEADKRADGDANDNREKDGDMAMTW